MKILYINESVEVYSRYKQGLIPSHWFYGAVEMENDGHEVIWCKEKNDWYYNIKQVWCHRPDIIFLPNLNFNNHFILLLLSTFHILRIPIFAYLHHAPKLSKGIKTKLIKLMLPCIKHLFFLSEKTMKETIDRGFIKNDMCSVPGWGPDQPFYDLVEKRDEGYFISTGKENRDFDILIEAFRISGAPLKIITSKSHAGCDYTDLLEKCKDISNIEVILTENTSQVYPMMLNEMAKSKALVCPLKMDKLDYCVGLSTIADAEGLHKPLIITENPYHNSERMKKFEVVKTLFDWQNAIERLNNQNIGNTTSFFSFTIQSAYENMKKYMNL